MVAAVALLSGLKGRRDVHSPRGMPRIESSTAETNEKARRVGKNPSGFVESPGSAESWSVRLGEGRRKRRLLFPSRGSRTHQLDREFHPRIRAGRGEQIRRCILHPRLAHRQLVRSIWH